MVTPQTPSHPGNPGNPGGNDLGDDPFNNNDNVDEATNVLQALGHAIKNLACATQHNKDSGASSGKTRVCKPDTFDGTDPKKLCTFLSYLKGMALEWFELDLLSSNDLEDHPLWMDDWKDLTTLCINKYVIDFNRLASQVRGYGDGALCHYFYSGLPDHIKDEICQVGKPQALEDL
ncbi:hypothetical protein ID866_12997 [Astraeus odoratus]|nr:hypothetical protein ID866_12997 [Astraeus odoratus]